MEKTLSENEIKVLREKGLIDSQEIAVRAGDLVLAENVLTRARRVIDGAGSVLKESKRQLLKG
jgi:hypothetical protein